MRGLVQGTQQTRLRCLQCDAGGNVFLCATCWPIWHIADDLNQAIAERRAAVKLEGPVSACIDPLARRVLSVRIRCVWRMQAGRAAAAAGAAARADDADEAAAAEALGELGDAGGDDAEEDEL